MSDSPHDGRNILDRSLDLLRGVSRRVQREAGRSWQISGLKAEMKSMRRERAELLRRLGLEAHRRLSATGSVTGGSAGPSALAGLGGLDAYSKEIDSLTARIAAREAEMFRLEAAEIGRPEAAASRPQKESTRIQSRATRPRIALAAARPVTGDPLEDILGKASDADLVEIEEVF